MKTLFSLYYKFLSILQFINNSLTSYNIGNLYLRHNGKVINRLFMSGESIVIMDKVKANE